MKKIKKLTRALLLAILLSLSMIIEVNAEQSAMTITGTITVRFDNKTYDDQLQAYKIIDYYYYSDTNELKHNFTKDFADFLQSTEEYASFTIEDYYQLTSGSGVDYIETPASDLENLTSKYLIYLKKNNIFGTGLDMNSSYYNATITVPVGAYLIYPTSTISVYAPMVANVDYIATGTTWAVKDSEISVKNSTIHGEISVGVPEYVAYSATIGEEYDYFIKVSAPTYPANAINKKYSIINELGEGIEIAGLSKFIIYCNSQEYKSSADGTVKDEYGNTIATITFIDQILTIDFNLDYVYSTGIYIEYKTKLNEKATIANPNHLIIEYSLDPYGTETYRLGEVGGEYTVSVSTYDLALLKYDADDENTLLNGAVFEIYADEDLTDLVGTITTGTEEDGVGLFHGLAQGTYYIKETKAPSGYKIIKDILTYEVASDQYVGEPVSLIDSPPEGTYIFEIPNEKISFLPVTGGVGTIIYTLTGLLIVGGAFYYIKRQNKKQTNT